MVEVALQSSPVYLNEITVGLSPSSQQSMGIGSKILSLPQTKPSVNKTVIISMDPYWSSSVKG